jgi:apolipoprotein N-acyltransferase
MRTQMKQHLIALLLGALAACGFQPWGIWPLTLAAFAGLMWLIADTRRMRSALALGWWFGVGHFCVGLNWIATAFTFQAAMPAWLGWIAVFLLSLYLAVYPAMAAGIAWKYGRRHPLALVLWFAAAWIATEWLRATMFTGFAWNPAGVALLDAGGLAAVSKFVGTYGLSGVAMLAAGAWFLLFRRHYKSAAALALPIAAAALALWPAVATEPASTQPRIRIVQPNIGQQDKWREGFADDILQRLGELSVAGTNEPRLLLWPEAAVTEPLEDGRRHPLAQNEVSRTREQVRSLLAPGDLLLAGGITVRSADGMRASSATNSVFAMDASGRTLGRYDKAHLVPYGEYLPMRPLLSALGLSRLAPGNLEFDPGPGPRTLDLPIVGKAGFQLCYEIVFSGEVVDRENRPNFLFNPSNDAWFGAWGPPQHLAQARLRALEEGLPVLRATPTGISAVIDADGHLSASIPAARAAVLDWRLPPPHGPTPFARLGNLLPMLFALLLAAAAIAVSRKAR